MAVVSIRMLLLTSRIAGAVADSEQVKVLGETRRMAVREGR